MVGAEDAGLQKTEGISNEGDLSGRSPCFGKLTVTSRTSDPKQYMRKRYEPG